MGGWLAIRDAWPAVLVANWLFPCAQVPVGTVRSTTADRDERKKGRNWLHVTHEQLRLGDELAMILIRRS
jgi:hypothetical protein